MTKQPQTSLTFDGCRQLPGWVRGSLVAAPRYGDVHGRLVRFFRGMAAAQQRVEHSV